MKNEDLYHEISTYCLDVYMLQKEQKEKEEFIEFMKQRTDELEIEKCSFCGNIGLIPIGLSTSKCLKCNATNNK